MISGRILFVLPLAAMLSFASAAHAQSDPFGLFGRRDQQRPPATMQQNDPNDPSELMIRIERLESQLRQLTGVVEQLQHENAQLRAANPNAAPPLPARAPNVQRPPQSGPQTNPPPVLAPSQMPPPRGDAFDPNRDPDAPGVPRQLGVVPQNQPQQNQPQNYPPRSGPMDLSPNAAPNAGPPPQSPPSVNPPQQQAVLPPSNSAKDQYDLAYGYILRRDFALAEQSFRAFISQHPDDRNIPQANYWLGESLFGQNKHNDAAEIFLDVYNKYPSSQRAPDSLLRLGQSLAALGKKEAACASLGAVLSKYPKASPTVKKHVADEQKKLSC